MHDIRESKVWQEAYEEGFRESYKVGFREGYEESGELMNRELVQIWLAEGKSLKEIAALLQISLAEVRRLSRHHGNDDSLN